MARPPNATILVARPGIPARVLIPVFVASIFLSAFLLFLVQPMVTRMLLPSFGGSPAVWNTALVFFQTVLLLGYLYAHWLARTSPGRRQRAVHLLVLALPLLLLPPALSEAVDPSRGPWPGLTLLLLLTLLIGAPFFVLSTNSSLVQHWCARSGLPGSDDPYWLYGASNFGSLLALGAYPFLIEPAMDLATQARVWSWSYGLFVVVTGAAMILASRGASRSPTEGPPDRAGPADVPRGGGTRRAASDAPGEGATGPGEVTWVRRGLWVLRAAVGTSLLLAVTMRITTDVASAPLFWVVPLAIYLVTFILAFGFTGSLSRGRVVVPAAVFLALAVGLLPLPPGETPLELTIAVNLLLLLFGALLCHRDLAADRPDADHLTEFYLWISFGGALGGILNSLVAPVVFDSVAEYPLTLACLALILYLPGGRRRPERLRLAWPWAVVVGAALALPLAWEISDQVGPPVWGVLAVFALLWGTASWRLVGLLGLSVVGVVGWVFNANATDPSTLAAERSFFGVVRVQVRGDTVNMIHGTTLHGSQIRTAAMRRIPTEYYHAEGPMGHAVASQPPGAHIGVVGLGTGALAALLEADQRMTFHEIDPLVVRMARSHFTYLSDSPGRVEVVLGDGRLTMQDVPDGSYDLVIVDAFSSDFVPTHLLTMEALELYKAKVRPGGLVLLHVSNRHADLRRVLKGYAQASGEPVGFVDYSPSTSAREEGADRAQVAALAPDPATVEALYPRPGWSYIDLDVPAVLWTDSRIDLPAVLW